MSTETTTVSRDPMVPVLFSVERAKREMQDTFTIDVRPSDGTPGSVFLPGQFNMLYVFGVGEVPISIAATRRNRIQWPIRYGVLEPFPRPSPD